MQNTPSIANMKAKALVIMATRRQDQDLVTEVVSAHGVDENSKASSATSDEDWRGVVPSYGWHPWFSHQIYDDSDDIYHNAERGTSGLTDEQKIAHYTSVLTPAPEDREFLLALPEALPLSKLLSDTRSRLQQHPLALVGEVGLDRGMRIPEAWLPGQASSRDETLTPGGREGRKLSPYKVSMEHQKRIVLAQLRLAGEMGRATSVHGVQCHGVLYETLRECWKGYERQPMSKRERKKLQQERKQDDKATSNQEDVATATADDKTNTSLPYPPRICLHSYSGPAEQAKLYLAPEVPAEIFFSFSLAINFSTSARDKTEEVIKFVPAEQILIESDLHIAGDRMDANLKGMAEKVCELKGWGVEEGVERLRANWMRFVFGVSGEDVRS